MLLIIVTLIENNYHFEDPAMVAYPSELPLNEIKSLITILRANEIAAKKAEFAHSLWVVQGYAQSKLIGSDDSFVLVSQAAECCGGSCESLDAKALSELEKAAASADGLSAQAIIDWKTILKFAAEKLIEYLLSQAL